MPRKVEARDYACPCGCFSIGHVVSAAGKCPTCGGDLAPRPEPATRGTVTYYTIVGNSPPGLNT